MFDMLTDARLNHKLPESFNVVELFNETDRVEEFFSTIRQNDYAKFIKMVHDDPTLVSECNDKLETALHIACKCLKMEMCLDLITLGASKNA